MAARHWRGGVRVFWRAPGESQIGVDPRLAVVIDGLDPVQQALLERLPELGGEAELNALARELGVGRAAVRALLDRLGGTGFLTGRRAVLDSPDARYWSLAAITGHERTEERSQACVAVTGLDQLGLRLARILAQAGVGRLLLLDDAPVTLDDLSPDGYRVGDLGLSRRERALALIRTSFPTTALTAPPSVGPDLVVLVEHGAVDPVRVRHLVRDDVAHLPVLVRELDVVVGPLVRPGDGPCMRCLDLHRTEDDARWPAVATQLTTRPPAGVETSLGWLAAALAAHQVLAVVDGRGVLVAGTTLEVSATYPLPRYREWSVHPACGCSARVVTNADAAAGTERRSRPPRP